MPRLIPALSLVETLVVVAIVAVVSVTGILAVGRMRTRQALASSAENVVTVLKRAHIYAREGRGDTGWGLMYLDSGSYQLVSGSPEDWQAQSRFHLDDPVVFASSFAPVWFSPGTGDTQSVTLALTAGGSQTAQITVNTTGVVDIK